ncbi:hypothetical protein JCM5296_004660 [Sporobolomyces johnsonii]
MAGAPLPSPPFRVAPPTSPLRQVNLVGTKPKSKLQANWDDWSTNPSLFTAPGAPSSDRFFSDFFCLTPNSTFELTALARLSTENLLGPYKNNVTHFFTNAVKILKDSDRDDVKRSNVIETLFPFLRDVLNRSYSNYSFEIMTMLAGSLERSDQVFTDLVSSIDLILQDTQSPTSIRHRILQLALLIVASVDQGSVNAYFLRRDLFSTLVSFVADEVTQQFAFESALLLGILANFRKTEARNPYGVRIEDFVEEGVMSRIIEVVQTVCIRARDSYVAIIDDAPPSFVASLTSLVFGLRFTELLTSPFSFSLPPPPPPPTYEDANAKGKAKAEPQEEDDDDDKENQTIEGATTGRTPSPPVTPTKTAFGQSPNSNGLASASAISSSPARPALKRQTSSMLRLEETPFARMPNEMVVILLPFYDLLNSNKTFGSLVFSSVDGEAPILPPALISLSSYIVCHASTSLRAQLYSRLCLILLMILVEEGEGKLTAEAPEIRLCRQRQPMLAHQNGANRPPIAAMVDTVVIFLRHNLRKRLDVETYVVALRLLQRIMQQLKAERVRLDYDWVVVWRSILTLSGFVVSHITELRAHSTKVDSLISQIFITISYAAYWGEQLLPSSSAQAYLYYELLHADSTLSSLSDLLGISSLASPVIPSDAASTPPSFNRRDTPTRLNFFTTLITSPTRSSFSSASGTGAGFVATECVSNIRSTISFFNAHIDALRETKPAHDEVDPDEILAVIEANLAGVELIESAAMGDLRRFAEEGSGLEGFFKTLVGVVCEDTLGLLEAADRER